MISKLVGVFVLSLVVWPSFAKETQSVPGFCFNTAAKVYASKAKISWGKMSDFEKSVARKFESHTRKRFKVRSSTKLRSKLVRGGYQNGLTGIVVSDGLGEYESFYVYRLENWGEEKESKDSLVWDLLVVYHGDDQGPEAQFFCEDDYQKLSNL